MGRYVTIYLFISGILEGVYHFSIDRNTTSDVTTQRLAVCWMDGYTSQMRDASYCLSTDRNLLSDAEQKQIIHDGMNFKKCFYPWGVTA